MYPANRSYGGNGLRNGLGYGFNGYGCRVGGRGGLIVGSKHRPRGRGNGFFDFGGESQEGMNELNRGPRAGHYQNQRTVGPTTIAGNEYSSVTLDKERYNGGDFPDEYSDAKFFVIKSYSEDDVHKSIKYNVWSSTAYGNKKLDAGYQEAQGNAGGCPVLLFFSVNASGQFVGVAEMVGPVDFNKTVEYWQQGKWIGCFPVKWHIIKDVPNSILKHITLENNDNKPVTNSRDTQEVMLEQGLRMLKIFKEHINDMCVLDDFDFYENRQNLMQERRTKQQLLRKQASHYFFFFFFFLYRLSYGKRFESSANFPMVQVWSGKTCRAPVGDEKGGTNGNPVLQSVSVSPDEPAGAGAEKVGNGVANGVAIVS
ncbi:hypothetical protein B296_00017657 [Ensete ventricosum]|uniref:YTH domain-containing family protein n=1 Tax=Ensete ventricosum TaxID=4639 RepID=A0A426Z4U5_ENSVE|nr:hypothetical protein B296_00017657 [Ensete ventricosum]